jgi:hypothetical protein
LGRCIIDTSDAGDSQQAEGPSSAYYAARRTSGRFITSASFPLAYGHASHRGLPAKTAWEILADNDGQGELSEAPSMEERLHRSPTGRVQIMARVVGEVGRVTEMRLQRVTSADGPTPRLQDAIRLDEVASARLIDFCALLSGVDPTIADGFRVDEALIRQILEDPERLTTLYQQDPAALRDLIENDINATDVLALRARRSVVENFERMLEDEIFFAEIANGRGAEATWQVFFEQNPWLLGVGLSAHLFTSWDPDRLERYVAGSSVAGVGKEADALLETQGAIRSLVYAEIKRHSDELLLDRAYRSGTWPISPALAGGVAQAHSTVLRAQEEIGAELTKRVDGIRTGEITFNIAPRSYLVIGSLKSLTHDGRIHDDRFRSFELFRRSLTSPEILTYDEVLARAKWFLELLADQKSG